MENLLDLLALARARPPRSLITNTLTRIYIRCADSGVPELRRLASTVSTWWAQILAFILTGIANADSKGTNRVIKTIARDAYGFRNPKTSGYGPAAPQQGKPAATSTPLNLEEPG